MKTSLIITTYNRADALSAVIFSALRQSVLSAEVIIADDGSDDVTRKVIEEYALNSAVPIHHVWQPDCGFRLSAIRNRAMAAASYEHIVFIDGDMLLHKDFLKDHQQAIVPKSFIQGSRVLLSEKYTAELLSQPLQHLPSLPFYHQGVIKRQAAIRLPPLSHLLRYAKRGLKGIKGCNLGFWRKDAILVNGFNQDFEGWGREDSEFVARLYHNDITRRDLKFAGIAYHLWHTESSRQTLNKNEALLEKTLQSQLRRCKNGLNQWL